MEVFKEDLEYSMRAFEKFRAASVILNSRQRKEEYRSTILFLVGFAYELGLKSSLFYSGKNEKEVRAFGHNIKKMWDDKASDHFRIVSRSAVAKLVGFDFCTVEVLERFIMKLDCLHTKDSGYALRYASPEELGAPDPTLLIIAGIAGSKSIMFKAIEKWREEEPESLILGEVLLKLSQSHYMKVDSNLDLAGLLYDKKKYSGS